MDNRERFYLEVPSLERKEEAIEYINEFTEYEIQIKLVLVLGHLDQ